MPLTLSQQRLPWSGVRSEIVLFRAILSGVFVLLLFLSIFISSYTVPEKDRAEEEEIPPQLARLLQESKAKKVEPKPLPKKAEAKPEPKVTPKPKVEKKIQPKPVPKQSVKKAQERPETKKSTAEQIQRARDVAKQSGVLALQSDLATLSSAVTASAFKAPKSSRAASDQAKKVASIDHAVLSAESSVEASSAQALAQVDRDLKGQQRLGVDATQEEIKLAAAERAAANKRSEDELLVVVEGLRSTFNLLYNRALRDNPFLEGRLVLKIRIESSGLVSDVQIVENTLDDETLVAKLIARMKLTNFGASDAEPLEKVLPFEFTPS